MPTGYTKCIAKDISFNQFVLNCARAFGAFVSMRDSEHDAPIPDKFEPSDYHAKEINEINKTLEDLNGYGSNMLTIKANEEYEKDFKHYSDIIHNALELRTKYINMLDKVKSWQPPSPDHRELKEFMIQQITDSIEFDCNITYYQERIKKLQRLTGQEWKAKENKRLINDLAYHTEENIKEVSRTNSRNKWIWQLRDSLK